MQVAPAWHQGLASAAAAFPAGSSTPLLTQAHYLCSHAAPLMLHRLLLAQDWTLTLSLCVLGAAAAAMAMLALRHTDTPAARRMHWWLVLVCRLQPTLHTLLLALLLLPMQRRASSGPLQTAAQLAAAQLAVARLQHSAALTAAVLLPLGCFVFGTPLDVQLLASAGMWVLDVAVSIAADSVLAAAATSTEASAAQVAAGDAAGGTSLGSMHSQDSEQQWRLPHSHESGQQWRLPVHPWYLTSLANLAAGWVVLYVHKRRVHAHVLAVRGGWRSRPEQQHGEQQQMAVDALEDAKGLTAASTGSSNVITSSSSNITSSSSISSTEGAMEDCDREGGIESAAASFPSQPQPAAVAAAAAAAATAAAAAAAAGVAAAPAGPLLASAPVFLGAPGQQYQSPFVPLVLSIKVQNPPGGGSSTLAVATATLLPVVAAAGQPAGYAGLPAAVAARLPPGYLGAAATVRSAVEAALSQVRDGCRRTIIRRNCTPAVHIPRACSRRLRRIECGISTGSMAAALCCHYCTPHPTSSLC